MQNPPILGLEINDIPAFTKTSPTLRNKLHLLKPLPCTTTPLRSHQALVPT
jgi:hypothetical protein